MPPRYKYNKCAVGTLLSFSFVLSTLSLLDCHFLVVDVGFAPENISSVWNMSNNKIGFGLWSMEDVTSEGLCVISVFQKDIGSLTEDDDIYNTFFIANDIFISTIRIISIFGQLLALVNLVIVWGSLFALFPKDILEDATITFYIVLLTFVCEGLKIGLMFMASPCDDDEFWERDSGFHKADQCFVGRGCYMSITATTIYLGITVHISLSMIYTDYTHVTESNLEYDDISMPSYLQSIAGSIMSSVRSKISSNASRISSQGSSNQRSRGSGEKSRGSGESFQRSSDGSGGNSIASAATGTTGGATMYAATINPSISSGCYSQTTASSGSLAHGRGSKLGKMPPIRENL